MLDEQSKEDRMFACTKLISGRGLTDGMWCQHLLVEGHIGELLTSKVHVFSDSAFFTSPNAMHEGSVKSMDSKKKKESSKYSPSERKCDIAGEIVDIQWHAYPGHKTIQILHDIKKKKTG